MNDLKQYRGWALITGASAGIGREFARAIAAQGVDCVVVARRAERLEELAEELREQYGIGCRPVVQDLSQPDAADAVTKAVADIPIGILVNNAGFGQGEPFTAVTPERMTGMVMVNCLAPILLTRALLPPMLKRGQGAVIMVGSVLSVLPAPYESVYSATKAFDLSFGEALWGEMLHTPIDVITLCPTVTKTEFAVSEGRSQEEADRLYANSDLPEEVVALTLRKLGKTPTVGPWGFRWPEFLTRMLPRKQIVRVCEKIMAKELLKK